MSDPQPADLFPTGGEWHTGELVIWTGDDDHDTGLKGYWDGYAFIVPFHDEMTVEEVARIVSQALRRRAHD